MFPPFLPMSDIATNRKARRDFHILETHEAGMELKGTEVKSIRRGNVNLADAYARVERGEMWLYHCHIQAYQMASHETHDPVRKRRLLLHKKEIRKLKESTEQKGTTLVGLRMYWKGGRVKVELGVGKGKDHRDQREDLKKRTQKRETDREMARFNR